MSPARRIQRPLLVSVAVTACSLMPGIGRAVPRQFVDLCHYTGQGQAHLISVAPSAVPAHIAQHGDFEPVKFYADADGDGFGDPTRAMVGCVAPAAHVAAAGDCADGDPATNPAAADVCDGVDNDCSGLADEDVCTSNCTPRVYGGHTYLFCLDKLNWFDAQTACQAFGYNLATINNAAENEWVVDTGISLAPSTDFNEGSWWCGANDIDREGAWSWVSGEPNTFQVFATVSPEPNGGTSENCIHLRRYAEQPYGWNDASCTAWTWHFVCESP